MSKTTVVTGIWDLKRDQAGEGFQRNFDHYINNFKKLLQIDAPMVIFISKEHEHLVWDIRERSNTMLVHREIDYFSEPMFPFYNKIQSIKSDEDWLSQAGWLRESTQATLDLYNPMVMSKMFMLNDAKLFNPFDTDYFIWLDGGITNTVHDGYFTHDKVLDKIHLFLDKFFFVSFPYKDGEEIHGFSRSKMKTYCQTDPQYVCRGGVFGGHKDYISQANSIYYNLLNQTLDSGLMGTEESIFTIMSYMDPVTYKRYPLKDEHAGLLTYFFEHLKNYDPSQNESLTSSSDNVDCALYVLTFNSPQQFSKLIDSFKQVPDFFDSFSKKFVIDNSTDKDVFPENLQLAVDNGFNLIKKDNIGICGGRQLAAEHFKTIDCNYMMFFEDDMFLNPPSEAGYCKNGFRKYTENLFKKCINICKKENLDFLKLSFSEFFGDNRTQWSWYNVPQEVREKYWPDYNKLPEHGLDPNAPLTNFEYMGSEEGLTYLTGDVYYANWPQVVSKKGNEKMFLETTWQRPYEQTWMSHFYQMTKENKLRGAVMLASPITHDRFEHYESGLRREN